MKRTNPIAAQVQPIGGRQLPANWRDGMKTGGNYDQRPLEDMWKSPNWAAKQQDSPVKEARLKAPSWKEMFGEQ